MTLLHLSADAGVDADENIPHRENNLVMNFVGIGCRFEMDQGISAPHSNKQPMPSCFIHQLKISHMENDLINSARLRSTIRAVLSSQLESSRSQYNLLVEIGHYIKVSD